MSQYEDEPKVFGTFLLQNYLLMYGDWDTEGLPVHELITLIVLTLLGPLILMNLLIAIISETFNNYNQNREEYDMRELVRLVLDFEYLLRWGSSDHLFD